MKMKYDDIIDEKVPEPKKRMSMHNRAAQFSAFAALSGYEEAIEKITKKQQEEPAVENDEDYWNS